MDILQKASDKRLTLAPVYSPGEDVLDLHQEWTSADELEKAVLAWGQTGDRTLRLQHQERTAIGEVLSMFVWPSAYEAPLYDGRGILKASRRFPAGSAFAWVRWTPEAWERLVKTNRVQGLSMGGAAKRIRLEAETDPAVAKSFRARPNLVQLAAEHGGVRLT